MAKERIVHEYEGQEREMPRPSAEDRFFAAEPSRAKRKGRVKPPETGVGWPMVAVLTLLVAVIGFGFVAFLLDLRNGLSGGDPNPALVRVQPTSSTAKPVPSPDTIKRRLVKAGFGVDFLSTVTDPLYLGYDAAETHIEGRAATIVVFKDKATANAFARVGVGSGYVLVKGDIWAISFGRTDDLAAKQLAEKIGVKFNARYAWTPQGE